MAKTNVTEDSLNMEIKSTQDMYYSNVGKINSEAERVLADKVKTAKKALSDFLSKGANVCPSCGDKPVGMVVRDTTDGKIYEVGCVNCTPVIVDSNSEAATKDTPINERRRVSYSSRGYTPEIAVANWNGKKFLIDTKNTTL